MAFAQLTYRESLRDIETCLSVHASKLYHSQPVRRSTLADANERRDWRPCGVGPAAHTAARCLTNKKPFLGGEDAHAARPAGQHSEFYPMASCTTFMLDMLLPEAGAIYVVDRGYVDFARLYVLHQAGAFFVTRANRTSIADPGFYRRRQERRRNFSRCRISQMARANWEQVNIIGERGEDADLDCRLGYVLVAIVKKRLDLDAFTLCYNPLGDPLRENAHTSSTCGRRKQMQRFANNLNLFDF